MTRRGFLSAFGIACLGALSFTQWGYSFVNPHKESKADLLTAKLVQSFGNAASAAIVGREYLRRTPAEADPRLLAHLLCSHLPERCEDLLRKNPGELRQLLQIGLRDDFVNGRVTKVQGWILSETEARLCALAALTAR